MAKNIVICDTARSLLLYLLQTDLSKTSHIYVMGQALDPEIFLRLQGLKIYRGYKGADLRQTMPAATIKNWQQRLKAIKNQIKTNKIQLYGLGHTFINNRLLPREPLHLLEDGLANLLDMEPPRTFRQWRKHYSLRLRQHFNQQIPRLQPFGGPSTTNIKQYIFTKAIAKQLPYSSPLLKTLDLKTLWQSKTTQEQQYINYIFQYSAATLPAMNETYTLLLTQPLSEDNYISEAEKIKIYQIIIAQYPTAKLLIKPHPRESTNYKNHFPQATIWQCKYPMELALLQGLHITKAITLFSTAIVMLDSTVEKHIYGILNIPGLDSNIEKILPVNATLIHND